MKAETPAEGILRLNDWGESKWYQISCDCSDPDHAHTVEIEADEHSVSVHIYTTVSTGFWEGRRWRQIWKLLTCGYAEYEGTVILKEQQAINYAVALTDAVKDVRLFRAKQQTERKSK